ncbi:unnamed protein product [Brachionus calyciflorus]|uniref:VWFA domain-containing protein n=1 Tax=Brachionus calyciflorus TaxID=104777 RepID=A0A813TY99_9BILA|nr:unnamed protein product [Brachionus calyciflorus]
MKVLIFLNFLLFSLIESQPKDCEQRVLDIVLVVDSSGSIGASNFQLARDALAKMVNDLDISPTKCNVGIVNYSYLVESVSSLVGVDQEKRTLINKIKNLPYLDQATATGNALETANVIFNRFRRTLTPRVLVLFTDGFSNVGSDIYRAAQALKNSKVSIYSVGIGNGINRKELEDIAEKPVSTYVKLLSDYTDLLKSINEITIQTCKVPAFIVKKKTEILELNANEVKNVQLELESEELYNINLKSIKGNLEMSASWLLKNESIIQEGKLISKKEDGHFYTLKKPENSERLYLKFKGIENENVYELNVY